MNPDEYRHNFVFDLEAHDSFRARSKQSDAGIVGVSDIYSSREKVRHLLLGHAPTDVPEKWSAIVGTYIHEGALAARKAMRPDLLHEVELTITLPNGVKIPGHADEIDPDEPSVTDLKTKDGLELIRRVGADEQQRAQRHLYYYGALQAGLVHSDKGIVRNVFIDRSGKDATPHVEQEPFDMNVVYAAQEWLSDPLYAAEHGEDSLCDWPREFCRRYNPFHSLCKAHSDPGGEDYLTGHRAVVLAEMVAAKKRLDEAKAVYEQARDELLGVTGNSDSHWVRSTVVNAKTPYTKVECGSHEGAA